jgi:hypothetical protein
MKHYRGCASFQEFAKVIAKLRLGSITLKTEPASFREHHRLSKKVGEDLQKIISDRSSSITEYLELACQRYLREVVVCWDEILVWLDHTRHSDVLFGFVLDFL